MSKEGRRETLLFSTYRWACFHFHRTWSVLVLLSTTTVHYARGSLLHALHRAPASLLGSMESFAVSISKNKETKQCSRHVYLVYESTHEVHFRAFYSEQFFQNKHPPLDKFHLPSVHGGVPTHLLTGVASSSGGCSRSPIIRSSWIAPATSS